MINKTWDSVTWGLITNQYYSLESGLRCNGAAFYDQYLLFPNSAGRLMESKLLLRNHSHVLTDQHFSLKWNWDFLPAFLFNTSWYFICCVHLLIFICHTKSVLTTHKLNVIRKPFSHLPYYGYMWLYRGNSLFLCSESALCALLLEHIVCSTAWAQIIGSCYFSTNFWCDI